MDDLTALTVEDPDLGGRLVDEAIGFEVHHHGNQEDPPGSRARNRTHETHAPAHGAQPEVVYHGHLGGVEDFHGLHASGDGGEVAPVGGPPIVGGRSVPQVPDLLEGQGLLVESDELVGPDARQKPVGVLSARRAAGERQDPEREDGAA